MSPLQKLYDDFDEFNLLNNKAFSCCGLFLFFLF